MGFLNGPIAKARSVLKVVVLGLSLALVWHVALSVSSGYKAGNCPGFSVHMKDGCVKVLDNSKAPGEFLGCRDSIYDLYRN